MLHAMLRCASSLAWLCFVCACAGRTPRPETPKREEIVVDEATVITAHGPGAGGVSDDESALPALTIPGPERTPSPAIERGVQLAGALIVAPSRPQVDAPDDQAGYDAWLRTQLEPWPESHGKAVQEMVAAFGGVPAGDVGEQVVAAGLVGIVYARTYFALIGVPPPPP